MIRALIWLAGTALIAFGTFKFAAMRTPGFIMDRAIEKILETYQIDFNEFGHGQAITAANQTVVRPSPDLAYSLCVYDLSAGPVEVGVPATDDYLSVSFYDQETNNYFILSDRDIPTGGTTLKLIQDKAGEGPTDLTQLYVRAPEDRGLILIRRVVTNENDWTEIARERERMFCRFAGTNALIENN